MTKKAKRKPAAKKQAKQAASGEVRTDDYASAMTSLGTAKDKSRSYRFCSEQSLPREELDALYAQNGLAARLVDDPIDSALAKGWTVVFRDMKGGEGGEGATPEQVTAGINERIRDKEKSVQFEKALKQALKRGVQYGTTLTLVGFGNGDASSPVAGMDKDIPDEGPLDDVTFVRVYSRHVLTVTNTGKDGREEDPTSINYRLPKQYTVNRRSETGGVEGAFTFAASRAYRYDSQELTETEIERSEPWAFPLLQRYYQPISNYHQAQNASAIAINELTLAVYKVSGFEDLVSTCRTDDRLMNLLSTVNLGKSVANAIVTGTDSEFIRDQLSVAGVDAILGSMERHISAVSGQPMTRLWGVSPGGFGTGEGEADNWLDVTERWQEEAVRPFLEWWYSHLFRTPEFADVPDKWEVVFEPLKTESRSQQADIYQKVAAADVQYVASGVLSPDAVRIARGADDDNEFTVSSQVGAAAQLAATEGLTDAEAQELAELDEIPLNGAQLQQATSIVEQVAQGVVPPESAIALLRSGLKLSEDVARSMIEPAAAQAATRPPPAVPQTQTEVNQDLDNFER